LNSNKKYLVTGAAGFIGFYLSKALLEQGLTLMGIDSLNEYYDVNLKLARLQIQKITRILYSSEKIFQTSKK
jgi:UDP-glucuronate 4-epimerase